LHLKGILIIENWYRERTLGSGPRFLMQGPTSGRTTTQYASLTSAIGLRYLSPGLVSGFGYGRKVRSIRAWLLVRSWLRVSMTWMED